MLVKYNGRVVDSDNFRVVLHHESGISKVAEGWDDYQSLLKSGEWFDKLNKEYKKSPSNKKRRKKRR